MTSSPLARQLTSLVACGDWEQVRGLLSDVHARDELDAQSLEILADASWWLGSVNECIDARRRALEIYEQAGDGVAAARIALLLSEDHRRQASVAIAESWRRRAERLLEREPECAEHGYLLLYEGEVARRRGRLDDADRHLAAASAIAERVGDANLGADVMQESGRLRIAGGAYAEGLAMMNEAMLVASEGRLSRYTTGKVYCCLLSACDELGDVGRMTEWVRTFSAWSRVNGVNVFPGMCRVHQAELLAHYGQWLQAEQEAERACHELSELGWIAAFAYCTIGRIRRRRGDLDGATRAFIAADERGPGAADTEAGFSMLLLARGETVGAMRRVLRALTATDNPLARVRLLPAQAEIAIAVGDLDTALLAVDELEQIAATYGTLKLRATASLARAHLCLARGDGPSACMAATRALRQWQQLDAPYEIAVARVLQARACQALDDRDGCARSLDIAMTIFRSLGAAFDLAEVKVLQQAISRTDSPALQGLLTAREVEVLRLLARGVTNKMIAAELIVSHKTVATHVNNIFTKLGVSTRAAATAYAYENDLVDTRS